MGRLPLKYMGSKRALIDNGLGKIVSDASTSASRFVDLFCGASSVTWFVSTKLSKKVLACDLQEYAVVLASSVIERAGSADWREIERDWIGPARHAFQFLEPWKAAHDLDSENGEMFRWRTRAQRLCSEFDNNSSLLVTRCYGGYYFSPSQALAFDAMLQTLPVSKTHRRLCLAAAIIAASNCVAAPGHTAQPFKATATAGKYLREAWRRDPFLYASKALQRLCPLYARHPGQSLVGNANEIAMGLGVKDLVFVDPPYSAVHYSRFYHVLETIARGTCDSVTGEGRYPPSSDRPKSLYSQRSKSREAIVDLLRTLANNGCTVIVTFPGRKCSNGLSGEEIEDASKEFFRVERKSVQSKFSTLGGNKINRSARHHLEEFILVLSSR